MQRNEHFEYIGRGDAGYLVCGMLSINYYHGNVRGILRCVCPLLLNRDQPVARRFALFMSRYHFSLWSFLLESDVGILPRLQIPNTTRNRLALADHRSKP